MNVEVTQNGLKKRINLEVNDAYSYIYINLWVCVLEIQRLRITLAMLHSTDFADILFLSIKLLFLLNKINEFLPWAWLHVQTFNSNLPGLKDINNLPDHY